MKRGANKQTNSFSGNVNAVDCSDCKVDASNLMVAMLGVKGVSIKVENGVVTVAKKSWCKAHKVSI